MENNDLPKDEINNNNLSDENNLPNEDDIIQKESLIDISGARTRYRKSILMFFLYFATYILSYLILSFVVKDTGIINSLAVICGMIPVYFLMGKRALNETETIRPSRKLSFFDMLFFVGVMYFLSLVFGNLTQFLMGYFKLNSVDVTQFIQVRLNITLFLYVVIIGPVLEELNYRAFHLNNLRHYGAYSSILLTTLIFSFAHGNFLQGIGTIGIGLVLGYVAYFYSFRYAVILHIINNLIVSILGLLSMNLSPETVKLYNNIFGFVTLIIMVYSFISLFTKNRRNKIKQNLKFTISEKIYLKTLLTDPVFYIYLFLIIGFMFLPQTLQ